ncbi:MAG: hypothetical protein Q4D89_04915 [Arachnia propionica]|uniref:DMP19 family protein n=1 Tax=Arachnia propionica TaxID=1750 RepID=UPI0026FB3CE4|nr:hypothetical protein [Arachnia propionica]
MRIGERIWLGSETVAKERESGNDWALNSANTLAVREFLSCRDGGVIDSAALHPDAVGACELDAFIGLSMRGGLLGHIWNSGWDPDAVAAVERTLGRVGAVEHQAVFREVVARIDAVPEERDLLLEWEVLPEALGRDLRGLWSPELEGDLFDVLDLIEAFLAGHPDLAVVPEAELKALLAEAETLPMRPRRPVRRYVAVVRAACSAAGLKLASIQERDPYFCFEGEPRRSVAFLASDGRRYRAVILGDQVTLVDDAGEELR